MDDPEGTSALKELDTPKILLGPLIADRQKLGLSGTALLAKVKEAIASGSDVNDDLRNGHRPLQLSIRKGYTEVACLLIESGADLKYKDRGGLDPIHLAINRGQFEVAKLLIKKGVYFPAVNPDLAYDYSQWHKFRHFGG
jgi:hypothetical protein